MPETVTPIQVIEDLAPWPGEADATPDRLARSFTVHGFATFCRLSDHPCWQVPREHDEAGKPSGAYAEALRGFVRDAEMAWTQYVAAYLLRERAGEPVDLPLHVALRRTEDSGELASETLGGWLVGYGIDAERIVQAVRAERGGRAERGKRVPT